MRLKKALLRYKTEDSNDQFGFSSADISDYSFFGNTDKREYPRFPGLILDANTAKLVGEAAVDLPVNPMQLLTDVTDRSQMVEANPPPNPEMLVWCALVHVQRKDETRYLTALLLEPESDSMLTYRRLGLVFLADSSWFEDDSSKPTEIKEEIASSILVKVIEIV